MAPSRPRHRPPRTRRLTDRDRAILAQTAEHGLITFEAIWRCHFPDRQQDAVRSTLRRLMDRTDSLLRAEPLDARRVYYSLTPNAARLLDRDPERARPFGLQAIIRRYALLWFLALATDARRRPCRLRDFPQLFPVGPDRLPQANFYLEERSDPHSDQPVLVFGFALVDHDAHHRRIVQRVAKNLRRFLQRGWFDDLIRAGAFELTVLTLSDGKQRAIEAALAQRLPHLLSAELARWGHSPRDPIPIPITVRVVPGLIDLIPGRTH